MAAELPFGDAPPALHSRLPDPGGVLWPAIAPKMFGAKLSWDTSRTELHGNNIVLLHWDVGDGHLPCRPQQLSRQKRQIPLCQTRRGVLAPRQKRKHG